MITIGINDAGAVAQLDALAARLKRPHSLSLILGREAVNQLRRHFQEKDRKEPNQLGGRRQHFWRSVAQSVQVPRTSSDGQSVTVAVSHPAIAQKVFGGVIRAKRSRYLTIPVQKESYGRTAETFEREMGVKLFFLRPKDGRQQAYLVRGLPNEQIRIEYILKPSVNQKADPNALPSTATLLNALLVRARAYVARATSNPGAA